MAILRFLKYANRGITFDQLPPKLLFYAQSLFRTLHSPDNYFYDPDMDIEEDELSEYSRVSDDDDSSVQASSSVNGYGIDKWVFLYGAN